MLENIRIAYNKYYATGVTGLPIQASGGSLAMCASCRWLGGPSIGLVTGTIVYN